MEVNNMTYQCPKGHQSTDSDYCSECGTLIGQSKVSKDEPVQNININKGIGSSNGGQDICPDCGTTRAQGARFCEVCRHDFQENKTGIAEAIVASQQPVKTLNDTSIITEEGQKKDNIAQTKLPENPTVSQIVNTEIKDNLVILEKLNVLISVNKDKIATSVVDSDIKPDKMDRVFPLDLDENLLGRRSTGKGIYPEIEINDPGVSRRHLKFIKQSDGSFVVLELGSANGTELNGVLLEPGVNTPIKAGDELNIGIWTQLKLVVR
jgi:hypothetical protein